MFYCLNTNEKTELKKLNMLKKYIRNIFILRNSYSNSRLLFAKYCTCFCKFIYFFMNIWLNFLIFHDVMLLLLNIVQVQTPFTYALLTFNESHDNKMFKSNYYILNITNKGKIKPFSSLFFNCLKWEKRKHITKLKVVLEFSNFW